MNGMELARKYYETFGAPMIHAQFPDCEEIIAAGLAGSGSECYGFDDAVSRDHDFEPGFCLFLPGEEILDRRTAFQLERAYAKLPAEFEGFRRSRLAPVGGNRHGVIRMDDFFREKIGCVPEQMDMERWLTLPQSALAEAVNGEIFRDDAEQMTDARRLLRQMPADARKKRLAGHLLMMAQSGQYNFRRCILHGETGAAQLAACEFARHAMAAWFLLEGDYMPYYKWCFRALRRLKEGERLSDGLERLISTGNGPKEAEEKADRIEAIAGLVIEELEKREWTKATCGDLEKHAYSVNDGIQDGNIRNLNILTCV